MENGHLGEICHQSVEEASWFFLTVWAEKMKTKFLGKGKQKIQIWEILCLYYNNNNEVCSQEQIHSVAAEHVDEIMQV